MEYSPSLAIQVEEEMRYINRGDPAVPDFTALTFDDLWHDLDLSGIVASAGASHLVHLRIDFSAPGPALEGWLREKGNVNTENAVRCITRDGATHSRGIWVQMDAQRKIEYRVWAGMSTFNIVVRGWWIG